MYRKIAVRFCLWGLLTCMVAYRWNQTSELPGARAVVPPATSSRGTADDPEARARYEWKRLRDPVTNEIPSGIRKLELEFAEGVPTREALANSGLGKGALLDWTRRGPFNVGGRTRALGIDVANENVILAGGVSGGMWRSADGGATWTKVTEALQLHSITALVQDTRFGKTNTWYYGTGEFRGNTAAGGNADFLGDGIYKSTDNGASWNVLPATSTNLPETFDNFFDFVWNVVVDASNTTNDEVYAATYGGIWQSTDGGGSWNVVLGLDSSPFSRYVDLAITTSGVLYTTLSDESTSAGVWRSTDGTFWTNITPTGWPTDYRRVVIGIATSDENQVYLLGDTPGSGLNDHSLWKYTYISGDGSGAGGTWEERSASLPAFGGPVGDYTSQISYDMLVKVKPDQANTVFVGGTNLYRSTDGFASAGNTTWIGGYALVNDVSQYDNHHPDLHAHVFLPSDRDAVISGHDGGLSKTTDILADSVGWNSLNNGYITSQFYAVAIDHGTPNNDIVVGAMQDNGIFLTNSGNPSTPWVEITTGDGGHCAVVDGRGTYYLSVQNGKTYRWDMDDNGSLLRWTTITPAGGSGFLFINPFVLDPNDNKIMYFAGGDRLWRNSDPTAVPLFSEDPTDVNWTELTNSAVAAATVTALGMSTSPANRLYYGTDVGQVYRLDDANQGDPAPTDVWTGKGLPAGAYVSCIAIDPTNADNALLVFSNYSVPSLFYTSNGGATWTDVSHNLEENPDGSGSGPSTRWAEIVPATGIRYYFVAASTGLYSTTSLNGGSTTWAQEGAASIGNVVVDMIDARISDGLVVIGTHGQGVYSSNVPITHVEEKIPSRPSSFSLARNYPNPFNPTTVIRYSLAETHSPQVVRLEVFNSLGQKVRTLVDDEQFSGEHEIEWDGKDDLGLPAASGLYVYQLQAGDFVESRKMVLLR